jgi:hypothetical protein
VQGFRDFGRGQDLITINENNLVTWELKAQIYRILFLRVKKSPMSTSLGTRSPQPRGEEITDFVASPVEKMNINHPATGTTCTFDCLVVRQSIPIFLSHFILT